MLRDGLCAAQSLDDEYGGSTEGNVEEFMKHRFLSFSN
jgi:hypothetical protein